MGCFQGRDLMSQTLSFPQTIHEACNALESGNAIVIPKVPYQREPVVSDAEKIDLLLQQRAALQMRIDDINDQIEQINLNNHPKKKRCDYIFSVVSGGCTYPACRRPIGATCPRPDCILNKGRSP